MKWYTFLIMFLSVITIASANPYSFNLYDLPTFNNNTAFVNETAHWITNIGTLSGVNATQHTNIGGLLNIDTSWLESFGDNIWCKLTGCTIVGNLEVNENISVGGQVNITGNMIIQDRLFVGLDPGVDRGSINPGDASFAGSVVTDRTFVGFPSKYGASLTVFNNGDNNPNITVLYLNFSASLNYETSLFCDSLNSPFSEDSVNRFVLTLFSTELLTTQVPFEIIKFVNSSCVIISESILGGDSFNLTSVSYTIFNPPVFSTFDNGDIVSNIGVNRDASFKINAKNATGHGKFVLDVKASSDGVHASHAESDINGFNNFIAQHSTLTSSQDANNTLTINTLVDADLSNFNDGEYIGLDIELIEDGNDVYTTGIKFSPLLDDLFNVGSPEVLDIAYYDNTTTTTDVTTAFTSTSVNIPIFEEDQSIIYIGNTINFTRVSVALSTDANPALSPIFFYCNSTGGYSILSATDGTAGFTRSGTISFISPADRGICNKDINGIPFANSSNFTYIAIQRNKVILPTVPIENTFGISGTETFVFFRDDSFKINCVDSAPFTCDASTLGAVYCDSTSLQQFFCDGSDWTATVGVSVPPHNSLTGIQGGTSAEYYHFTNSEHTELSGWLDDVVLSNGGNLDLVNGNFTLNSLITFGLGEIIDNLVDGWVRITGGLNVTGNLSVDDSTLFVDGVNNRVGIGTKTPSAKLSIKTGSSTNIDLKEISIISGLVDIPELQFADSFGGKIGSMRNILYIRADTDVTSSLFLSDADGSSGGQIQYVVASDQLQFETAGSYVFDDKVGIGTILPQNNLNVVGDTNITGKLVTGTNTLAGLSNGDINVSTIYYDTLVAKSPTFLCSEDWCSINFPKYQKTLWIQKNETWEILDIVYEGVSYTKKEFNNQICSQNPIAMDICLRLNSKINKLEDKAVEDMILRNKEETCQYSWDSECFEIVNNPSDYSNAVFSYEENTTISETYVCQRLNLQLIVEESNCTREIVNGTKMMWKFNSGCDWDESYGYYCNVRELR